MSRKHCRIIKDGDQLRVEDLGSSNGTYHNGQRVQGGTQLMPGDSVQVGPVVFVVQIDGNPPEDDLVPFTDRAAHELDDSVAESSTEEALHPPQLDIEEIEDNLEHIEAPAQFDELGELEISTDDRSIAPEPLALSRSTGSIPLDLDGPASSPSHLAGEAPLSGPADAMEHAEVVEEEPLPIMMEEEPLAMEEPPLMLDEEALQIEEEPAAIEESPLPMESEPLTMEEEPLLMEEEPLLMEEEPVLMEEEPLVMEEEPLGLAEAHPGQAHHEPLGLTEPHPEGAHEPLGLAPSTPDPMHAHAEESGIDGEIDFDLMEEISGEPESAAVPLEDEDHLEIPLELHDEPQHETPPKRKGR